MYEDKFYIQIKFPIETFHNKNIEEYFEQDKNIFRNLIILFFVPFNTLFLRVLGINKIINKEWINQINSAHASSLISSPHPLLEVSHIHKILIFGTWEIKINHFYYIVLRKLYILGDKKIYPECLNNHFFLKVLYESTNFRLNNIFRKKNINNLNKKYFESTNSLESLIEGRHIIGKISNENYQFLIKNVLEVN